MDYNKMTKEELIEYINGLSELDNGKYGIVWDKEKEPEQIVVDCDKKIPILIEDKKNEIKNSGEENILIEGDNFHSLSVLNYTHNNSVDVIYIDPPYNTGNKDFIYNDRYVDFEDGYKHSKWLNFMEKRLKIARNLLSNNGVLFISIDDNEQAQLKLLCDKIFGENNVETMIWDKITGNENAGSGKMKITLRFRRDHEYVIVCYKRKENSIFNKPLRIRKTKNEYGNIDNDPRGNWISSEICKSEEKSNPKGKNYFTLVTPSGLKITRQWHYSEKELDKLIADNRIYFGNGKIIPRLKRFLNEPAGVTPSSIIQGIASQTDGNRELNSMDLIFDNPKPSELIKWLIEISSKKDSIILDFFAGSGTTGEAVLKLNSEDGGKRKFILCTNNESNICSDVTLPRLNNCIKGYKDSKPLGGGLKYFKTDFVNYTGTRDQLYYDLTEKCIPLLCVKSVTYELIEKNKEYAIYSNKEKTNYSCVYFDIFGESYDKFLSKIKGIKEHKNLYIFSLSEYINEDNFKGINNYSIEPIPYKILDLYKNVVKMSKEN